MKTILNKTICKTLIYHIFPLPVRRRTVPAYRTIDRQATAAVQVGGERGHGAAGEGRRGTATY